MKKETTGKKKKKIKEEEKKQEEEKIRIREGTILASTNEPSIETSTPVLELAPNDPTSIGGSKDTLAVFLQELATLSPTSN